MKIEQMIEAATKGKFNVAMFSDGMCVFVEYPVGHIGTRVVKFLRWLGNSPEREANIRLVPVLLNSAPALVALVKAARKALADMQDTDKLLFSERGVGEYEESSEIAELRQALAALPEEWK